MFRSYGFARLRGAIGHGVLTAILACYPSNNSLVVDVRSHFRRSDTCVLNARNDLLLLRSDEFLHGSLRKGLNARTAVFRDEVGAKRNARVLAHGLTHLHLLCGNRRERRKRRRSSGNRPTRRRRLNRLNLRINPNAHPLKLLLLY